MSRSTHRSEAFDLNRVIAAGTIQKLWGRGGDVYARLRLSTRDRLVEPDDAHSCYVTLRFPEGNVRGEPVTLQPGSLVRVSGFLAHNRIEESIRRFLETAGQSDFLESVPPDDLPAWRGIIFQRDTSILNVRRLDLLDASGNPLIPKNDDDPAQTTINQVTLEGIVARAWNYPRGDQTDRFLRLAIYDRWTSIDKEKVGKGGRPHRRPHYINIRFPDGKTIAGQAVQVELKQRLRVTGTLADLGRRVTFHSALLDTGDSQVIELMGRLPGAERLQEISAQWESLHVDAAAVIVYSAILRPKPVEVVQEKPPRKKRVAKKDVSPGDDPQGCIPAGS